MQTDMKCPTCGGDKFKFMGGNSFQCAYCGTMISNATEKISTNVVSNKTIRVVRVGKTPLTKVMLEVRADGKTIGLYPFNVGFDMEFPVSPNMELNIQCTGASTSMPLSLDQEKSYTCKISYSVFFSYELYDENNVLLVQDKLSVGMWILSFLLPIVGIIYYFVKREESPVKAKGALIAGLSGIALNLFWALI